MTAMAGELWVADIPFTDGSASKKWPVLALWQDGMDVVVAAVTSAAARSPTDIPLLDWKAAGLRVPSTVRLSRLDCLEHSLLIHRLGLLSDPDRQIIKSAWDQHVQPQFYENTTGNGNSILCYRIPWRDLGFCSHLDHVLMEQSLCPSRRQTRSPNRRQFQACS
jgi:mRNA interferase MazF